MAQTSNAIKNEWFQRGLKDGENKNSPVFQKTVHGHLYSNSTEIPVEWNVEQFQEYGNAYLEGFNRF